MKDNLPIYQKASVIYLFLILFLPFLTDYSYCPFKNLTGLPCPGCGMTHSLHSLITLNFYDSWNLHPFAFLILPIILFFVSTLLWGTGRKYFYRYEKKVDIMFFSGGVMLLVFGLYRIAEILIEKYV